MTKLWTEANSVFFLSRRCIKAVGSTNTKILRSARTPLLMIYIFYWIEYYIFLGVDLSKDKGLMRCIAVLKHTLFFSNFTIVYGKIKRALSTCHCVRVAFMFCLITGKLFFWLQPRSEKSLDRQWGWTTFTIVQWEGNKDVVSNPSWGAGAQTLYRGLQAYELQSNSWRGGFVTPLIRLSTQGGKAKSLQGITRKEVIRWTSLKMSPRILHRIVKGKMVKRSQLQS